MPSPSPDSPVIRELLWKKTQIENKILNKTFLSVLWLITAFAQNQNVCCQIKIPHNLLCTTWNNSFHFLKDVRSRRFRFKHRSQSPERIFSFSAHFNLINGTIIFFGLVLLVFFEDERPISFNSAPFGLPLFFTLGGILILVNLFFGFVLMLSGEDIEVGIFSFLIAGSILASSSVTEARFLEARSSEVFTLLISSCSMKSECSFFYFVTFLQVLSIFIWVRLIPHHLNLRLKLPYLISKFSIFLEELDIVPGRSIPFTC